MGKSKKTTIFYFANGGYLMKAFFDQKNPRNNDRKNIISAKRIWSTKLGYGVLIKGGL